MKFVTHLDFEWLFLGVLAWWGYMFYRYFKHTDTTQPAGKRMRSLIRGRRYDFGNPDSPDYDPDFFGRALLIVMLGLVAIGLALLLSFWLV